MWWCSLEDGSAAKCSDTSFVTLDSFMCCDQQHKPPQFLTRSSPNKSCDGVCRTSIYQPVKVRVKDLNLYIKGHKVSGQGKTILYQPSVVIGSGQEEMFTDIYQIKS